MSALNDLASEVAMRATPLYLENVLGVGKGTIGAIEGAATSTAILLKLAAGVLSDRVGRRKPLALAGYGLSNLAKPLLLVATTWQAVLALRLADRVGKGIRTTPRDALIAESVPAGDRGRAFGFHRSMDPLGSVAGLALAAAIVHARLGGSARLDEGTFRLLALVAAVPALLSVAIMALAVREPPRRTTLARKASLSGTLPPALRRYLVAAFAFNLSTTSEAFFVLRAQERGLPLWTTLSLLAGTNVVLALVSFPTGALSDRFGRRRFLAAGWIVWALVLAGFAVAESMAALVALFALNGLYQGLTEGVEKALVTDLAPEEARGTAFGWVQLAAGVAAFPASGLTGVLARSSGWPVAFGVGAVIALAGAALLATVPAAPSSPQPPAPAPSA